MSKSRHTGRDNRVVEILRTPDEIRAAQKEWEDFLLEDAGEHDLRQQPFYILSELAHPVESKTPFVVVLRDNGIRCVAPFFLMDRKITAQFGPFEIPAPTVKVLRPFGDRIVHRRTASPTENVNLLLEALAPYGREFDAIWLPEIRMPGDFWDFFKGAGGSRNGKFRLIVLHPSTEVVQAIALPGSFDTYMASLKSNTRRKRRSRLRRLQRHCSGNLTVSVITQARDVRSYLHTVDDIRNDSWKAEAFSPNRWRDENRIRFHEQIASRGWFKGYLLHCGDRPIAFQLGYTYRDLYVAEEIAYVADMRSESPGAALVLLMLEELCQSGRGCRVLLQPTDSELKRSFGNETYEIGRAVVVPKTSRGKRLLFGSQRFFSFQHARVARMATRLGPFKRVGQNGSQD